MELARSAGLFLDPWQQYVLDGALGERADGKWSAFEVGLIVPRQNGKGAVLEARELAGLFLFGEQLILHSAHEFKTASEAFRRVLALVENTDALRKLCKKPRTSHGDEGIELLTGARLRFVARSTGSGRGFSGDCIVLDEAYNLNAAAMAALLPTLSARANPQLWYASSAGMESSEQLRSVRERGIRGGGSLAYFEWSAPEDANPDDREAWAVANPAMGIRISEEFVSRERDAMPEAEFARERLGIWDDPDLASVVIPLEVWARHASDLAPEGPRVLALDVSPLRDHAAIACCTRTSDGRPLVRLTASEQGTDYRLGTDWVVPRLAELSTRHNVREVHVFGNAAASLTAELERAGLSVVVINGSQMAQGCGLFYDAAMQPAGSGLVHNGQPEMATALSLARRADSEHGWTWGRRKSAGDITPVVAATVALWAHMTKPAKQFFFAVR